MIKILKLGFASFQLSKNHRERSRNRLSCLKRQTTNYNFHTHFSMKNFASLLCIKNTKKLQVIYLKIVQVSSFEKKFGGKFCLHKALPAHCSGKFT